MYGRNGRQSLAQQHDIPRQSRWGFWHYELIFRLVDACNDRELLCRKSRWRTKWGKKKKFTKRKQQEAKGENKKKDAGPVEVTFLVWRATPSWVVLTHTSSSHLFHKWSKKTLKYIPLESCQSTFFLPDFILSLFRLLAESMRMEHWPINVFETKHNNRPFFKVTFIDLTHK